MPHLGIDYAAPRGTSVYSIGDGKIIKSKYEGAAGNYVKIKHNSVYTTGYMHLWKFGKGIRPGMYVKQGQIIGYVGSTGLATGNHVCYRFWKNGKQVDALKVYIPPSEPIVEEHKEAYFKLMNSVKAELDSMSIGESSEELFAGFH